MSEKPKTTEATPGPWVFNSPTGDGCRTLLGGESTPGTWRHVADVYPGLNPAYDLPLIAASQDLLAACEFLLAQCQREGVDSMNGPHLEKYIHADAAIAKAKGTNNA